VVLLLDDGIATRTRGRAAIRAGRADGPRRVVVATGVAPPSTIRELGEDAEEVVSVLAPWDFQAVGQFYRAFGEVSDDDVLKALGPAP
jgi:predicted phosphoribosyltransferase